MTLTRSLRIALLCATAGIFAVPAISGNISQEKARLLGTSKAHAGRAPASVPSEDLRSKGFKSFQQAAYATGGVAMRNRDGGVIHISGLSGISRAAYIYWAYLFPVGVAPPATQPITIQRLFPTGAPPTIKTVTGALIATGGDPCWASGGNAVYRAAVPVNLATGNGYYRVTLDKAAIGLTTGEDPWDGNVVYPLSEGASMVLIGDGTSNVTIFDKPMSGVEFEVSTPLNYSLILPLAPTGNPILFDSMGADGQIGVSRLANDAMREEVTINGTVISGAGGLDTDSDWNGSSGFPLPQLWDDTGHDISPARPAVAPVLKVTIQPHLDCLVAVANVVSY